MDEKFIEALRKFYEELLEKQEPMDPEFMKIWDENREKLYESSADLGKEK